MDWNALIRYKLQPPYIPDISRKGDCKNFSKYDDEDELDSPAIKRQVDPFINW